MYKMPRVANRRQIDTKKVIPLNKVTLKQRKPFMTKPVHMRQGVPNLSKKLQKPFQVRRRFQSGTYSSLRKWNDNSKDVKPKISVKRAKPQLRSISCQTPNLVKEKECVDQQTQCFSPQPSENLMSSFDTPPQGLNPQFQG